MQHLLEDLLQVAVGDLVGEVALERVELGLERGVELEAPLPAACRDRLDAAAVAGAEESEWSGREAETETEIGSESDPESDPESESESEAESEAEAESESESEAETDPEAESE
ncbi:MAG: hypothetical protein QM704_01355 [Anaeromyxobacteraceae bacterium]